MKKRNLRKQREQQKFESIFFVQKYYERQKWKKGNWSKNQETKFPETHFAQTKLKSRFVGEKKEHKNIWAKFFGDKHWCQKFETKKNQGKYKEKS